MSFNAFFDFRFQMPRHAVHPDNHRDHKRGRNEKKHSLEPVFADFPALQRDGDGEAGDNRGDYASPHPAREIRASGTVQINEYDADDQGGLDTFTKSNEDSREQNSILQRNLPASRFTSWSTLGARHVVPLQPRPFRVKTKPAGKMGAQEDSPLVATHSQLELQF